MIIFPVECQAGARIAIGLEVGGGCRAVISGVASGASLGLVRGTTAPVVAADSRPGVADGDVDAQPAKAISRPAASAGAATRPGACLASNVPRQTRRR